MKDKDFDVFTFFTIKTYFFFVFDVLQSLSESSEINSDIAVNNSSKINQGKHFPCNLRQEYKCI